MTATPCLLCFAPVGQREAQPARNLPERVLNEPSQVRGSGRPTGNPRGSVAVMARIYHLAEPDAWAGARSTGSYDRSTRGLSLAQQGFIHCSEPHQWPVVRSAFYGDVQGELVLLEIEPDLLEAPLVREAGNPATGEEFPHVYGRLNVSAVVGTRILSPPHSTAGT